MIEAVAVVIHVHDEEEFLDACLAAVRAAASGVDVRVDVWGVLDDCRDGSLSIARRHGVHRLEVAGRAVGRARAAGVAAALAHFADVRPDRLWTAHTDADSVVPPHWLEVQLAHAAEGADVVVGTVRPDFADLSPAQVSAWRATHTPGVANGHVHGANLGIRADALVAAGGFDGVPVHEDVLLVGRMRAAGAVVAATDAAWVLTSGRAFGRAPDGYARYLREDLIPAAETQSPCQAGLFSNASR